MAADNNVVSQAAGKQESVECNENAPWRPFSAKLVNTLHQLSPNEPRINFPGVTSVQSHFCPFKVCL